MIMTGRHHPSTNCRRRSVPQLLVVTLLMLMAACQRPTGIVRGEIALEARPWAAADGLFRQDPRWLGADDAHSVDLDDGRILWLFGDTFIDESGCGDRYRAALIRNSVGIQTGRDPSRAAMLFFWRRNGSRVPASFFSDAGKTWVWPGDGVRIGSRLLIFLMRLEPSTGPLGFAVSGWRAVVVDNPHDSPNRWHIDDARLPRGSTEVTLGSGGVLHREGYLYAYGTDPGGTRAYLARWPEQDAGAGDLRDPQWWCGEGSGWRTGTEGVGGPAVLFADAQVEFGVHFEPRIQRFIQIQTTGFGGAGLGFRTAFRPEGGWGALIPFFSPEEASIQGILIYAAKSHPFLDGADIVLTYATNHMDASRVMADKQIYFPRFVGVAVRRGRPEGLPASEE